MRTQLVDGLFADSLQVVRFLRVYRKAFDLIDHSILIKKLYSYGIRGQFLELFESYFSDRSHCVNREVKIPRFRFTGTGSVIFFLIFADVSIFTRNFYPFSRCKP